MQTSLGTHFGIALALNILIAKCTNLALSQNITAQNRTAGISDSFFELSRIP